MVHPQLSLILGFQGMVHWVVSTSTLPLMLVRASPALLSMWPCTMNLDEEKSKHARLAQQNGSGPASLYSLLRLVKGTTKPNTN